jgi:hypothetical protein
MKTTCGAGGSQNNFGRDAEHKDVELWADHDLCECVSMCVFVYMCVYVCTCVHVCECEYVCLCAVQRVHVYVLYKECCQACVHVYVLYREFVLMSICVCLLCLCVFVMFMCVFAFMFMCVFVLMYICVFVFMSMCCTESLSLCLRVKGLVKQTGKMAYITASTQGLQSVTSYAGGAPLFLILNKRNKLANKSCNP